MGGFPAAATTAAPPPAGGTDGVCVAGVTATRPGSETGRTGVGAAGGGVGVAVGGGLVGSTTTQPTANKAASSPATPQRAFAVSALSIVNPRPPWPGRATAAACAGSAGSDCKS